MSDDEKAQAGAAIQFFAAMAATVTPEQYQAIIEDTKPDGIRPNPTVHETTVAAFEFRNRVVATIERNA